MQALTPELQEYWHVPQKGGIIINRVFPESPAEKASLQVGDVILAIDDSALFISKEEESAKLRNLILSYPVDSEIELKVFRNKKVIIKKARLTAAPKAIGLAESHPIPEWGFEIRELTRDIIYQDNLPLDTKGVFVFQVDRASPAGIAGLRIGDIIQEINGKEITNLTIAQEVVQEQLENPKPIKMLKLLSNRSTRFVFIDLKK
jgi:S1-C subfamily serine protease